MATNYFPSESFNIDDGSLAGLPPQVIFILGVEWALTRYMLMSHQEEVSVMVHASNLDRVKKMIALRGREILECDFLMEQVNQYESIPWKDWIVLKVGPAPYCVERGEDYTD